MRFQISLATLFVAHLATGVVLIANLETRGGGCDCSAIIICADFFPPTASPPNPPPVFRQFDTYGMPWPFIKITTRSEAGTQGTAYEIEWLVLLLDTILWAAFVLGTACTCERLMRRLRDPRSSVHE